MRPKENGSTEEPLFEDPPIMYGKVVLKQWRCLVKVHSHGHRTEKVPEKQVVKEEWSFIRGSSVSHLMRTSSSNDKPQVHGCIINI